MLHRLVLLKILLSFTPLSFASFSPVLRDQPHLKILLLGDVAVGKSSILRRYMDNSFEYDTRATIGIDFFMKKGASASTTCSCLSLGYLGTGAF